MFASASTAPTATASAIRSVHSVSAWNITSTLLICSAAIWTPTSAGFWKFLIVNVDPAKAPSTVVQCEKTAGTDKETVCGIAGMILLVLIELLKSIRVIGKSEHCTLYTLLLLPIERKRG